MSYTYLLSDRHIICRTRMVLAFALFGLLLTLGSCKKNEVSAGNPATLSVFNALEDGTHCYIDLSGSRSAPFRTSRTLFNKNFALNNNVFNMNAGTQPVAFYSTLDTLPKDAPVIDADLNIEQGVIYSMFLYGSKSAADYYLIKEQIPASNEKDSVTFIRFANFSEEQDVSINLKDEPAGSFAQQLPKLSLSEFTQLKSDRSVTGYEFEIRDRVSGDLLTTYTVAEVYGIGPLVWFNKAYTLVLTGKYGGTGNAELKIVRMPHR